MTSKDFYNALALYYDEYCTQSGIHMYQSLEIALVARTSPRTILEIGVGTGRFANAYLMQHENVSYVGIDNSIEMLSAAQNESVTLIHTDAGDYISECTKNAQTFDCIILMYSTIHHIETKEQRKLFKMMQYITNRIIINCLTKAEELKLFTHMQKTLVTFITPVGNKLSTPVYPVHESIRKQTKQTPEGGRREYLVWEKIQSH